MEVVDGANHENGEFKGDTKARLLALEKGVGDLWTHHEKQEAQVAGLREEQVKIRTTLWLVGLLVSPIVTALLVAAAMAAAGYHH